MKKKGLPSLDPGKTKKLVLITVSACLGLLVILSAPSSPVAQEVVIRFQKPLQHEVSVTLKLIQVYVTDKKGKAIQDLQKSDFLVYDNGQLKDITEFEKHILAGPTAKTGPATATETIIPTAVPPQPQVLRRKFFLFVDFAFNNQNGIQKAKEAALHFIDKEAGYDDEVGLISYSTLKGLTIHEYLTIEHQKIRKALEALNVKDIAGEVPKGAAKLFIAVPCSTVGLVQPEIVMTADLVNSASGERIPLAGPILDRIQKEGGEARFLELLLNNIPPGKYLLYLHAEAAGTEYVSYAKANLTIKQTFLPSRRKEMWIKIIGVKPTHYARSPG
jgi:hypothetical protein